MEQLSKAGWDGPVYAGEGKYRYSKTFSWIRLYIDIEDVGFYGGVTVTGKDFEVALIDGKWRRFDTEPAQVDGEPVIRLIEYSTWDLVLERVGDGLSIDHNINTIDDMAMYLERCIDRWSRCPFE
jgi:hypothetical protein